MSSVVRLRQRLQDIGRLREHDVHGMSYGYLTRVVEMHDPSWDGFVNEMKMKL